MESIQDFLFSKASTSCQSQSSKIKVSLTGLNLKTPLKTNPIIFHCTKGKKSLSPFIINQKVKKQSTEIVTLGQKMSLKQLNIATISSKFNIMNGINLIKLFVRPMGFQLEIICNAKMSINEIKMDAIKQIEGFYKCPFGSQKEENFSFIIAAIELSENDEYLPLMFLIEFVFALTQIESRFRKCDFRNKTVKQIFSKAIANQKKFDEVFKSFVYLLLEQNVTKKRILIIKSEDEGMKLELNKPFKNRGSTINFEDITKVERMGFNNENHTFGLLIHLSKEHELDNVHLLFEEESELEEVQKIVYGEISGCTPRNKHIHSQNLVRESSKSEPFFEKVLIRSKQITRLDSIIGKDFENNVDDMKKEYISTEMKKMKMSLLKTNSLFDHMYSVKTVNLLNFKNSRILKFSEKYHLEIYKASELKFINSFSLKDIKTIISKDKYKSSVKVYFHDKKQKPMKFKMDDEETVHRFLNNFNEILLKFDKTKMDKSEENRKLKRYSWLMLPRNRNFSLENKKDNCHENKCLDISFFVINETSKFSRKQIIHLNFDIGILNFLDKKETILKAIESTRINSFHLASKDPRKIILNYDVNKKEELVFYDIKNRLLFESALSTMIYPELLNPICNYIILENCKIFTSTWNVGFSEPNLDIENAWFSNIDDSGIIALGLQECKISSWLEKIQQILNKRNYTCISMALCIFAKKEIACRVSNIETSHKATGIGKIIGNKGGIMTSFNLFGSTFCFHSCHLAAKVNMIESRRENFYDLCQNLRTGNSDIEANCQFDYTFWLGDLNYRIECFYLFNEVPFDETVQEIKDKNFEVLRRSDQLFYEKEQNNLLADFIVLPKHSFRKGN